MGQEGAAPQVEVDKNREIMVVVSPFKYLGSYYSKEEEQPEDVKMREKEGLKTFDEMKMMCNVGSASLGG